jgi:hypothetical protein
MNDILSLSHAVRDYIKKQEKEEERLEQLSIFKED